MSQQNDAAETSSALREFTIGYTQPIKIRMLQRKLYQKTKEDVQYREATSGTMVQLEIMRLVADRCAEDRFFAQRPGYLQVVATRGSDTLVLVALRVPFDRGSL